MDFMTLHKQSAFVGLLANAVDTSIEADYYTEFEHVNNRELIVVSQKPRRPVDSLLTERAQIVETKIFIGLNDHIIYGCNLKHTDGSVAKTKVTEFTPLDKVPDSVFALPTGSSEIICTNANQYAQVQLEQIKAQAKTPRFQEMKEDFKKKNSKGHYVVLSLMLIPTILFAWFLLHSKNKKNLEWQ